MYATRATGKRGLTARIKMLLLQPRCRNITSTFLTLDPTLTTTSHISPTPYKTKNTTGVLSTRIAIFSQLKLRTHQNDFLGVGFFTRGGFFRVHHHKKPMRGGAYYTYFYADGCYCYDERGVKFSLKAGVDVWKLRDLTLISRVPERRISNILVKF